MDFIEPRGKLILSGRLYYGDNQSMLGLYKNSKKNFVLQNALA